MNNEMKDTMDALGITAGAAVTEPPTDGGIDYKAKYEEAMQELASARVEQGRVKRLDGDLKAAKQRIAELERQTALGTLPEDLQDVPDSVKETALHLSKQAAQQAVADMDGRMANLEKMAAKVEADEKRRMAQLSNDFIERINQDFPDFIRGLKAGGSFKAAWDEYQIPNAASIKEAFAALDYNSVAYHINRFYDSYGVVPSGGQDRNATPDPRSMSGGASATPVVGGKKTYTKEGWEAEYDDLQDQYDRGAISPKTYAEKRQVLLDVQKEGRIKFG